MLNQKNIELVKESFLKDLIIVTGAPASGKSILAPIVSSLERTENFKMDILLEYIGIMHYLGKLPSDVLRFLFRNTVDFMLYDNMIGRNLNFRFGDETSIFNTNDPEKYFDRLLAERGEFVINEIEEIRPLLVLALSNAFWHVKDWFEAFPFLKMIQIRRHPTDIVYSWYNHRYGEGVKSSKSAKNVSVTYGSETYNSKINQVALIRVGNNIVPYYALGWENDYIKMCEMDRVIYMIDTINKHYYKALESLSDKEYNNLLFLTFDETVVDTNLTLDKICQFLNTSKTNYTSHVLERERCPRILQKNTRDNKFDKIKELASKKGFNLFKSMHHNYYNWGNR